MSIQIGTYSKKKMMLGDLSYNVTIPKARRVHGRTYPYKSQYLTDDVEDIQKTIRADLKIEGHVKLVPTSSRGGRIVVI